MAIPTKAAPLANRAKPQVSLTDLQKQVSDMTSSYGEVPVPTIDPRTNVQAMVGAVPQVDIPRTDERIYGRDLLREAPVYEEPSEVAQVYGTRFGSTERMEPVLDDQGNTVVDPVTGQPVLRPVTLDDHQRQLEIEQARQLETRDTLEMFSADPAINAKEVIRRSVQERQNTMFDANARQTSSQQDQDDVDRFADSAATDLSLLHEYANMALFTADTKVGSRFTDFEGNTDYIPAGVKVLAEEGIDLTNAPVVGTVFGLALAKSSTQSRGHKGEPELTKPMVITDNGAILEGADYMLNFIDSVKHFAKQGLQGAGVPISPAGVESMAKAMVYDALQRGDLVSFNDPKTGRPIVGPSQHLKDRARNIAQFAEAIVGDIGRRRSAIAPARGGTSPSEGKPLTTMRSVKPAGVSMNTSAAELAKDYMGSVGLVFRAKDVKAKTNQLEDILDEANVQRDQQGRFMYSRSIYAKRNGVSQADFNAAKLKTKYDPNFDGSEGAKKRHDAKATEQAIDVMGAKLSVLSFAVANTSQSPGIRYAEYMHSFVNQRFFPASFDVDYMGDKAGVRDMLGLASQDSVKAIDLFDPVAVSLIQNKGIQIFSLQGRARHDALEKLSPGERGAIGAMISAVMNYHSAVGSIDPNIEKYPEVDLLRKYTPKIGQALAAVGAEYNQWLENPREAPDNIKSLIAGMEKGESMGSKNLWDDFYNLHQAYKNPTKRRNHIALTHHVFDDGNQNGIFLQSLFFGQGKNAVRLGTYNPNLDDMRTFGFDTTVHHIQELTKDDPAKRDAWAKFFKAITEEHGKDSVAKDFFKQPLMQHAYGKDASMFGDLIAEILSGNPDYTTQVSNILLNGSGYKDAFEASQDLSRAVETSLREIIDSGNAEMMKAVGRMTAVLNTALFTEGVTGDTHVYTPVSVKPVNKSVDTVQAVPVTLPDGRKILTKSKEFEGETFKDAQGNLIEIPSTAAGVDPNYAKPTQVFYNKKTGQFDEFHNALGTSQARSAVVMPIQSLDGDLVKWTTIFVNQNRKVPRASLWVHDSIISTPGDILLMRNAYNNVAIKEAIPYIQQMGNKFANIVKEAKRREVERVLARGNPVGIGADGEYPSLGALLDEMYDRTNSQSYKQRFLERNGNKTQAYEEYVGRIERLLKEAKEAGWVPQDELPQQLSRSLAVKPAEFKALVDIAYQYLKLDTKLDSWANNFSRNVQQAAKELLSQSRKHGIAQMTQGATGKRGSLKKPEPVEIKKEEPKGVPPLQFNYSPNVPF